MTIAVILSKLQKTSRHPFDLATLFSQKWSRGWEYKQDYSVINYLARFIDSKWTF